MTWAAFWTWLTRVPGAVWVALAGALTLLSLVLRNRRLEADLSLARAEEGIARAKAATAKHTGAAEVHLARADELAAGRLKLDALLEARVEAIDVMEDAEVAEAFADLAAKMRRRQ